MADRKKVLVTGGCHGIGLSICNALSKADMEVKQMCRHTGFDALALESYPMVFSVDILVNNVGGGGRWKDDDWQEVFTKNAMPMVELTNKALPYMIDKQWGRVITISSVYGKEAGGTPGFAAAKAYQIAWMKAMSKRGYPGITFNTVCPGGIEIDGKPVENLPKPHGQPNDIANLVTFLCSDNSGYINGATIVADGGFSRSF